MTPTDIGPRVVVGLDGTATGLHAVSWAAAEAWARGCALSIVHASAANTDGPSPGQGRNLLDLGTSLAREHHPDLPVSVQEVVDEPAAALLDAAEEAVLLVVGLNTSTIADSLLGTIALDLLARASCPVAVVRPPDSIDGTTVVAGVEPGRDNSATLAAAFAAAAAHHLSVTVVYVQPVGRSSPPDGGRDDVALWSMPYPSVRVDVRTVPGDPAEVLADLSRGARMLAVGSNDDDHTLFGVTTRSLAGNSRCPVVVVRRSRGTADGTSRAGGSTTRVADPPVHG